MPNLEAWGIIVVIKDRDFLGGILEHAAVMRLISERCDKLVPIFSPCFFSSKYNNFLATFVQSRGLEERTRKLIPLIYEQCDIPSNLDVHHKLAYNPTKKSHAHFWSKLAKSLS